MRRRAPIAALAAAVFLLVFRHPVELRLLRHGKAPRPDASAEPSQVGETKPAFTHLAGGRKYRLIPRFRWDESARVVGAESYHFGPAGALLPTDLALAWGPLLRPPYAGRVSYSQFSRFYFWRTRDGSLDRGTIVSHSANTHVIPATARLLHALRCVGKGDDVRLQGWLVDVEGVDDPSFRWGTSTTREDEGPSSCETVYLERLTINERVYE
jgi:hypothetical protein